MKIVLVGNPNSGKTTMFNALTGRNEKVGNWAGVTVDKKRAKIRKRFSNKDIEIVDLPGAYSISPFTEDEKITRKAIEEENADLIINIVDATNISRGLFFTTQLLELGVPLVVALNKADINRKNQTEIDVEGLSNQLNCPVIETISTSKVGLKKLIQQVTANIEYVNNNYDNTKNLSDEERFGLVSQIVEKVEKRKVASYKQTFQDKVDNVITNKWVGIPIFAVVMFLVFGISQAWVGPLVADTFVGWLESGKELVFNLLANDVGELNLWSSILVEGVIGGVIAVISFLPLVMIMYFLITLLEDCGYMARASVVLDPIFKKVGLSGKSIIPFVIGTGCAIPGIMACRTIKDERERRATAMLTPFMPCGAKLPIIALFSGVFFDNSAWVGVTVYFLGIIIILVCALLIKAITCYKAKKSYFIIELPQYKAPDVVLAIKSSFSRGLDYIVKAGTIILICNFVVYLMQTFNWSFEVVDASQSILHDLSTPFAYVIAPIVGVCVWQLAAATVTGFIAKENVVGTLAVCFSITNFIDANEFVLINGAIEVASVFGITRVAGLAFLTLNLFSPPCFAAIGAMRSEIDNRKWFWSGILLQLGVGYTISYIIGLFGSYTSTWMPIVGGCIVLAFIIVILAVLIKSRKSVMEK